VDLKEDLVVLVDLADLMEDLVVLVDLKEDLVDQKEVLYLVHLLLN